MTVYPKSDAATVGRVVELGKYHAARAKSPISGDTSFSDLLSSLDSSQASGAGIMLPPTPTPGSGFFRAFAGSATPDAAFQAGWRRPDLGFEGGTGVATAFSRLGRSSSAGAETSETASVSGSAALGASSLASIDGLAPGTAMKLADYPRPLGDNGRGMHWVPTTSSSKEVVDRFVGEARDMKIKWMVILNDGTDATKNDYLVSKLVENGIMPIMRVYTHNGRPITGDLAGMVRHYKSLGVSYFQLYNEPNNNGENPDGVPNVDRYLDKWIPAAKIVAENGGLPGFGALSPGGNVDDLEFLRAALERVKQRGEVGVFDKAWVALHNYAFNRPIDYDEDSNGFLKFRWYDEIIRQAIGRSLPIISTEGGTHTGIDHDKDYPVVDEGRQAETLVNAYRYMSHAEPYYLAYSHWVIANEAGGGTDPDFTNQALFGPDGAALAVAALKGLG